MQPPRRKKQLVRKTITVPGNFRLGCDEFNAALFFECHERFEEIWQRGYVQLTWEKNYVLATRKLRERGVVSRDVDLVRNPDLAMRPDVAAGILVFGMVEGWFTGRKLIDYFKGTRSDWIDARAIINGSDRAKLIASYGMAFYHAIDEANRSQR